MLMHKLYKTILISLTLMVLPPVLTQAEDTITIEDGAIATAIKNRIPQKTAQSFPATVGMLYCFTKVVGSTIETSITHTWYSQDKKMSEVVLPVKSLYWRNWSSREIMPEHKGAWRVDVTSSEGTLLKTITFTIE
jgi:hypothetical protein